MSSNYKEVSAWGRQAKRRIRIHGPASYKPGAILAFSRGVYERQTNGSLRLISNVTVNPSNN